MKFLSFILSLFSIAVSAQDTFIVKAGGLKGKELRVNKVRPYQLESLNETTAVVKNFTHELTFYKATIPLNAISRMVIQDIQFVVFPPFAHHQLRVDFKEPIILENEKGETIQVMNAIFTAEPAYLGIEKLKPIKMFSKHYTMLYRLHSLEDVARRDMKEFKRTIKQLELDLTHSEQKAVFMEALAWGDKNSLSKIYHATQENCTTELYHIFDQTLGSPTCSSLILGLGNWFSLFSSGSKLSLKARDLLKCQLPTLNQELK